jgi:hypothetical protein
LYLGIEKNVPGEAPKTSSFNRISIEEFRFRGAGTSIFSAAPFMKQGCGAPCSTQKFFKETGQELTLAISTSPAADAGAVGTIERKRAEATIGINRRIWLAFITLKFIAVIQNALGLTSHTSRCATLET